MKTVLLEARNNSDRKLSFIWDDQLKQVEVRLDGWIKDHSPTLPDLQSGHDWINDQYGTPSKMAWNFTKLFN